MSKKINRALSKKTETPKKGRSPLGRSTQTSSSEPTKLGSSTPKTKSPTELARPRVSSVESLEGEPTTAPSAPNRARPVVREQSRLAHRLSGSRSERSSSRPSPQENDMGLPFEPYNPLPSETREEISSDRAERAEETAESGQTTGERPWEELTLEERVEARIQENREYYQERVRERDESEIEDAGLPQGNEPEENPSVLDGLLDVGSSLLDRGREFVGGIRDDLAEAQREREAEEARFIAAAQEEFAAFTEDPGSVHDRLDENGLAGFTDEQRLAVAWFADEDESIRESTVDALSRDLEGYEKVSDIPSDRASQILINSYASEEEVGRLGSLLQDELANEIDSSLRGRLIEETGGNIFDDYNADELADRAIDDVVDKAVELGEKYPALAGQLEDRLNSAFESRSESITDFRRSDDGAFSSAAHSLSGAVDATFGFVGDSVRFVSDKAGDALALPVRAAGAGLSAATDGLTSVGAAGLDFVGADGAADAVRRGGDAASEAIEDGADFAAEQVDGFVEGLGEGGADFVEGVGDIAENPVGSAYNLGRLAYDLSPFALAVDTVRYGGDLGRALDDQGNTFEGVVDGVTSGIRETREQEGNAAALGQATFDVITGVASGGSSSASRLASRVSRVTRSVERLDDVADLSRLDEVADLSRVDNGSVLDGRRIADRVEDSRVGDAFRRVSQRRHNRISQRFREQNPALAAELDATRSGLDELLDSDLPLTADSLRDFAANSQGLARSIDELHSANRRTPGQAGTIVETGREAVLGRVLENLEDGSATGRLDNPSFLRQQGRLLRNIFSDSDPAAQLYLSRLDEGASVFRSFSGNSGPRGSYFGRVFDRRQSVENLVDRNALPKNSTPEHGVVVQITEPEFVVVSRVGPQAANGRFDDVAGGNFQLLPVSQDGIVARLKEISAADFESGTLPPGIEDVAIRGSRG